MPTIATAVLVFILCQVMGAWAGIAGFHKWFSSAFPTAVKRAHPRQEDLFDHVCIDMNQILHVAVRKANNEEHAMRRLYKAIDRTLKQCMPRQSVVFAFDGSAPLAKLLVQRRRRENMKDDDQCKASTLHLSPGTEFMEKVASAMEQYAFMKCQKSSFRGVKFYISGASIPGEGEVKCVDWINRTCLEGTEESVVLVGGDADLILQGLALTQVKNLFVVSPAEHDASRCTSIWEVVRALEGMFPGQSEFVRADMMVLMILNGNDYLPKARGVAFRNCFRSYVKLKAEEKHRNSFLVKGDGRTLSRDFMVDLLEEMSRYRVVQNANDIDIRSRYPPAGAIFNEAVSQGKLGEAVELQIHACSSESEAMEEGIVAKWRSKAVVGGREYSWLHTVNKKKAAMHEAAEMLLEHLLPDVHKKYVEQELARLEERLEDDYDKIGNIKEQPDSEESEGEERGRQFEGRGDSNNIPWDTAKRHQDSKSTPLFDVKDYLTGILWNLQMYVDGYAPNFYWRYTTPYGPSCQEIASWIKRNPEAINNVRPSVSSAPPLPAALSALCMMPMTDKGRALLPKRLQQLLTPGSPLRKALAWRGAYSGLDVPGVLRALQEQAPGELDMFTRDRSRIRKSQAWTVVSKDDSIPPNQDAVKVDYSPSSNPLSTTPDSVMPPPDQWYLPHRLPASARVRVGTMAATTAPRCVPWSCPNDPSTWLQPKDVLDQPYKKAFVKKADVGSGGDQRQHRRGKKSVNRRPRNSSDGRNRGRRRGFGVDVKRDADFPRTAVPPNVAAGVTGAELGNGLGVIRGRERTRGGGNCCFRLQDERKRGGRIWMCQSFARSSCRLRL